MNLEVGMSFPWHFHRHKITLLEKVLHFAGVTFPAAWAEAIWAKFQTLPWGREKGEGGILDFDRLLDKLLELFRVELFRNFCKNARNLYPIYIHIAIRPDELGMSFSYTNS
jgi:hypothetical protein